MLKKIWRISTLKYLAAFLIPAIFVLLINQGLDNDSWDVIAEGREIARNGLYYTDMLSMHDDLSVTVQNYGFAVIFYYMFSLMGGAGIYFVMLVLNLVVCYLIYKICMLISGKNVNMSLLLMMVTDLILALGFVTTRAQMVSYVLFLLLIYVLELYIKYDKARYLWWIPLLSVLQINLHASLWWMLIFVLMAYIVDSIKRPKLHLQGYRTKPLLMVGVLTLLAGLINPYGIGMITFIFSSYGDARFHSMVAELSSFSPLRGVMEAFIYIAIVVVMCLYIFGEKKDIRVRYLLLFFGLLALGLNTIKGMSQFILVMFFPLALLYKDVHLEKVVVARKSRNALIFWLGIVSTAIFVVACPMVVTQVKDDPREALVEAVNAIDDNEDSAKEELKIYAGYNDGGYLEYRGYKPYLDPRGEVFLKKNNKKEDILYEWDDFNNGRIKVEEFLDKYHFDYLLVVGEKDPLYALDIEYYKKIFEEEEQEIKVFERI